MTEMHESVRAGQAQEFDSVLAEAQRLGYAEADPSTDIDGIDAAHKLAILTSVVFGCPVDFDSVHVEGIRHVSALDIGFAIELGYRVKLLGIARAGEAGITQRVHPCMIRETAPIARVDGVFNAVVAEGDRIGSALFEGTGRRRGPHGIGRGGRPRRHRAGAASCRPSPPLRRPSTGPRRRPWTTMSAPTTFA